ncbi:MAG: hypothetical protein FJ088_17050 [Deltaproteobacteria bacterium]|nr:hypothetical protein [Deltaproteobacteria bacterium]
MGPIVIDSSALITLARADALFLLPLGSREIWTIPEVYQETVEAGLAKGYPDAIVIQKCFQDEMVCSRPPRNREKLSGVSSTDSRVIFLAEELSAVFLLVNDHALLRRAEEYGVPAQFTAEYVKQLCEHGALSRRRMESLFRVFLECRRYSEEFLNALMMR